ncbi:MAG: hypothetical protein FJ147_19865 [Deltaproteobacteria bacterium]|nr:hypothetical protein [Deltaproteobacteria bacterium]
MASTQMFHNARLFDGLTDQPRSDMSIVVTNDRITSIEQRPVPAPAGAQVIDLQGKAVVPGLIDTHVHSTFVGTPSLPLFLAAGVTSARDVGGNLEKVKGLKADLNNGKKLGPRLFICGPLRDVRELRKLSTVYRGGVAHDPQALLAQVPKSDFVPLS